MTNCNSSPRAILWTIDRNDIRPSILGFTLSLMMLLQVIGEGSLLFIQASSIVVLLTGIMISASYRPTNRIGAPAFLLIILLGCIITLGAFRASTYLGIAVFYRVTGILMFLILGLVLAQRKQHSILEKAFPVFSLTFAAVLIFVLIDNDRHWDRLRGHLHSNLWAFIAASAVVGIPSARVSIAVKTILIGFVLYMIAFEFQARGPLVWATFTISIVLLMRSSRIIVKSKYATIFLLYYSLAFTALAVAVLLASSFIFSDILEIDSATRGIGSGLTGRSEIWHEFFIYFSEKPLFGYGFDMSRYFAENYFANNIAGDISSTHNSYLTILFDFGLVGFIIYIAILLLMLVGALRSNRMELVPFLIVFLLMAMTESRPLNVGNPAGLLFVLLMPYYTTQTFLHASNR